MFIGQRHRKKHHVTKPIPKIPQKRIMEKRMLPMKLLIVLILFVFFLISFDRRNSHQQPQAFDKLLSAKDSVKTNFLSSKSLKNDFQFYSEPVHQIGDLTNTVCSFRRYSRRRYYGLELTWPNFLADTPYIRGMKPKILSSNFTSKICIDSSEWEDIVKDTLKFSDGQNPSLIHLPNTSELFVSLHKIYQLDILYAVVMTVGDSQCSWKESEEESRVFHLSTYKNPPSIRSLLIVLNEDFNILFQKTIMLLQDATNWGKKKLKQTKTNLTIQQLDDVRLFRYKNDIYLSFRNGKHFGYTSQVQNRLYFDSKTNDFYIKASESIALDGGRNFAMFESQEQKLMALTWVDPVTVATIDTNITLNRKVQKAPNPSSKKRSNIHGTNGMLILFQDELLGIAHFHRPEDRQTSNYARHGHHYTHAFYTISSKPPFKLRSLSNEFIFPSAHDKKEGDLIQFAAGLDLYESKLIISYGINDCEGAIMQLPAENLKQMLIKVDHEGQEVVDFMKKIEIVI